MATNLKWYGDDIIAELRRDMPDALYAAAEEFLREAQGRVRKSSGDLHDSAYINMKGRSTYKSRKFHSKEVKAKEGEVVVGFAAFYAKFVEFGTRKMRAKPFMRPTLDESKSRLAGTITAKLRKTFTK